SIGISLGKTTATFFISPGSVSQFTPVLITANFSGVIATATLDVVPFSCQSNPAAPECLPPPPSDGCQGGAPDRPRFRLKAETVPEGGVAKFVPPPVDLPPGGRLDFFLGERFRVTTISVNNDPDCSDGEEVSADLMLDGQILAAAPVTSEFFSQPTRLFPQNVLILFAETGKEFLPVHSGDATLKVSIPSTGDSFSVAIHIESCPAEDACPFRLGTAHNQFDPEIIRFADLRGIPPQILKAQIQAETDPDFEPQSYRYEPLTVDFGQVSTGRNLRTEPRLEPYRLETTVACTEMVELDQGAGLPLGNDTADVTSRHRFQIQTDPNDGPICELLNIPPSPTRRQIDPRDRHVSMENILLSNENQNWTQDPRTRQETPGFRNYVRFRQRGNQPFTAQTPIAASYGLMQVLYTTAVLDLNFRQGAVGQPPSRLFEPPAAIDLGTEYLRERFRRTFPGLATTPNFLNVEELKRKIGVALEKYNRGDNPRPPVNENNLRNYATSILQNSENFYPVR
ncbi:MAG: hypothetical protein ACREA0_01230, partial [bacterium]